MELAGVAQRQASPVPEAGAVTAQPLPRRTAPEIYLHAYDGSLVALAVRPIIASHPRLLYLSECALSAVRKLEFSTRLRKADVHRAGVDA